MKRLKAILMLVVAMMLMSSATMMAQNKREFRGAWIQCVNGQYLGKSTQQIQAMLTRQLDELQKDGVNAIIFQVRAECEPLCYGGRCFQCGLRHPIARRKIPYLAPETEG